MFKKISFLLLIVSLALSACGTLEVSLDRTPTPAVDAGQVATMVAATLAAIPSATAIPEPTATLTPEAPSVLPRSLYYLAKDANDQSQIYRLSRDGVTVTQITSEAQGVSYFDVSPMDGKIAYLTKDGLVLSDFDGANQNILAGSNENLNIFSLYWSPDGKSIAYNANDGIYLYTFSTKQSNRILTGSGTDFYRAGAFSPDSKKLIVKYGCCGNVINIYDLASNTLTPLLPAESTDIKFYCGRVAWIDSGHLFCYFHFLAGATLPGLWRVNANDGSNQGLVYSRKAPFMLVTAPREDTDGNLFYLFAQEDGIFSANNGLSPLSLVRSDADGVKNRVALRPETFSVADAIWTLDGNALLILQNDEKNNRPVNLILVPVDPSLPVMTILADASRLSENSLRWGP